MFPSSEDGIYLGPSFAHSMDEMMRKAAFYDIFRELAMQREVQLFALLKVMDEKLGEEGQKFTFNLSKEFYEEAMEHLRNVGDGIVTVADVEGYLQIKPRDVL